MKPNLPIHIAIIPDGNRRWAKQQGLRRDQGHTKGAKNIQKLMKDGFDSGIPYMTFWVASEDNLLKRSRLEVRFLAALLAAELVSKEFEEQIMRNQVQVKFIGRWHEILRDAKLAKVIRAVEAKTAHFKELHLTLLFGYDGRTEMIEAIQRIQAGHKKASRELVQDVLWTGNLPPVDVVIRTGEEDANWNHWSSGFMMWQTAESQFYSTKTLWPAFSEKEFSQVLTQYASRERRFGK